MSAYNNEIPQRDDRLGSGQLNENHGIAATGLNDPYSHSAQGRRSNDHTGQLNENHGIAASGLNDFPHTQGRQTHGFSGPAIADERKVDQTSDAPGMYNPSPNNRTAATGIPPVNTAQHITHRNEQDSGVRDLPSRAHGDHSQSRNDPLHSKHSDSHRNYSGPVLGDERKVDQTSDAPGVAHNTRSSGVSGPGVPGVNRHGEQDSGVHDLSSRTGTASHGDHGASHHEKNQAEAPHGAISGNDHPTTTGDIEHKPSMGEKVKGNFEKMAGKVTGNQNKVVKGENLAHGRV